MIGLEPTFEEHLANLVDVFREVRRVLRKDGTLWLNYGDAYFGGKGASNNTTEQLANRTSPTINTPKHYVNDKGGTRPLDRPQAGLKPKDLMMMPAQVAIALRQPHLKCRGCLHVAHETQWGRWPNGRRICPGCEKSKGCEVETQAGISAPKLCGIKKILCQKVVRIGPRRRMRRCFCYRRVLSISMTVLPCVKGRCVVKWGMVERCPACGLPSGRDRWRECKKCAAERMRKWRGDHPEQNRETDLRYKASHHGKEARKKYRQSDANKEIQRRYRLTPEGKAAMKRYRQTQARKEVLERYSKSKKGKENLRRYHATDKGRAKCARAVHKRRMLIGESTLTSDEWKAILNSHGNRCLYCGATGKLTMDHVIPLSKGGEHIATNIVPACLSCNASKGNKSHPRNLRNVWKIATHSFQGRALCDISSRLSGALHQGRNEREGCVCGVWCTVGEDSGEK